jgi:hypothetical protein
VQAEITTSRHLIAGFGHDARGFIDDQRSERRLAVRLRSQGDCQRPLHEMVVQFGVCHGRSKLGSNKDSGSGAFFTSLDSSAKSTTDLIDLNTGPVAPLAPNRA